MAAPLPESPVSYADMEIYQAELGDLNACLAIDDSFETEYVWQMEEKNRTGHISVAFQLTHLPRPMKVMNVISDDDLFQDLQNGAGLYVAYENGVRGFVDVRAAEPDHVAYIANLAVQPMYRRTGIGTRLVRAALDWASQQRLRLALLNTSTKNYPAICFFQKLGFKFCGFNDQYYANRDIALFFSSKLR